MAKKGPTGAPRHEFTSTDGHIERRTLGPDGRVTGQWQSTQLTTSQTEGFMLLKQRLANTSRVDQPSSTDDPE